MSRYTQLTQRNKEAFSGLTDPDVFILLDDPGTEGIGAVTEEEEPSSQGIVVFHLMTEGEVSFVRILWFYVGEEYRGRGIGNGMMEHLLDVLSFLGEYYLSVDIPEAPDYDPLLSFFRTWKFFFQDMRMYSYTLSVEEVLQCGYFKEKKPTGQILSIDRLSEQSLQTAMNRLRNCAQINFTYADVLYEGCHGCLLLLYSGAGNRYLLSK
ncbi:MAG: GNAT family N-acetyltransferase [Lachnospiraceae bacterium]|nr:GNAT family N-acetyltransferase [Lachnospiraceae bacterium]